MQVRATFPWVRGAVLVAALLPSCSGPSSAPLSLEDFSTRLANMICDRLIGCCKDLALPFDPATCRENARVYLEAGFTEHDPTRVRYDGTAANACLSAYDAALVDCRFIGSDSAQLNTACRPLLVGLVPIGGACQNGQECAAQASGPVSCNYPSSSAVQGNCTADSASSAIAPHAKQGAACAGSCALGSCDSSSTAGANTTALCFLSEGLYCAEQNTCQPVLADGEACSYSQCGRTSYCADSKCTPMKADGVSCSASNECLAGHCSFPSNGSADSVGVCGQEPLANAATCAAKFDD